MLMFQDFESSTNPLLTTINFVGGIAGFILLLFGVALNNSLLVWLGMHLFIGCGLSFKGEVGMRSAHLIALPVGIAAGVIYVLTRSDVI